MAKLSPGREKAVLKTFGRASIQSAWWKELEAEIRFCLRCGGGLRQAYVAAEKRRRRVCGKCAFIAYQNPKVVAATLPLRDGRIYLLRRDIEPSRGLWTFPAGYQEMGETVEQAALRETREEIRCRVKITGLHNIYSYPDAGVVTIVYKAAVVGRAPSPGHETQAVRAFSPSEIPWEKLAFRSTFHALKEWIQNG